MDAGALGRRRRRGGTGFDPLALYSVGEAGLWADPSDLTPEKISWRRNLLTWSESFDNSAWTKSNASILSNLVTWSEQFDNATWTKTNASITANVAVAPDGTNTADKLVEDSATSTHWTGQSVTTVAIPYTFSVFVKAAERTFALLYHNETVSGAIFNLSNGAVTTPSGIALATASAVDAGNGWYRCSITVTATAASNSFRCYVANSSTTYNYAGNGTNGILVWGAQLVPGTSAQTYTPTTSAIAPIQFTDPFGNATADKLVENTANNQHQVYQTYSAAAVGVPYTFSVMVAAAERSQVNVQISDNATGDVRATFNLSTGTVGAATFSGNWASAVASISAVGNGFYRCAITGVKSSSGNATALAQILLNNGSGIGYTGDGSSGVLLFGAQLDVGTVASSYQRITDFTSDFLAAFPTHALYQDSAGTTPVTALGQPVGLVIDKRLGGLANLGAELIANGGPSFTATTGWTARAGCTIAATGGNLVGTSTGTGAMRFSITSTVTAGRTYRVTANIAAVTGSAPGIYIYSDAGFATNIQTQLTATPGTYTFYVTATTALLAFDFGNVANTGAGQTYALASFTVREAPGSHAIQPTPTSRPSCDARVNLLTYSEQFDNAAWTKLNTTISANTTTAPNGTSTADKVLETNVTNFFLVESAATASGSVAQFAASVYLKAAERTFAVVRIGVNTFAAGFAAIVNLSTGQIANTTPIGSVTGTSASIENIGDGWYRVTLTANNPSGAVYLQYGPALNGTATALPSYAGNSTSGILAWGADLRVASDAAFPYQRVVTASDYADVGAPRYLTFDGIDDSLYTAANVDFATWTSGTRRNLLTYPSAFDNAVWNKAGITVAANTTAVTAPDGTQTADTFVETATTSRHLAGPTITGATVGIAYTLSAYLRKRDRKYGYISFAYDASNGVVVQVDLDTGTVAYSLANGTNYTLTSSSVQNVGNGWYRVIITGTIGHTTAFPEIGLAGDTLWTTGNQFANTYLGDITKAMYVWGAQLELGTTATTFQDVGTDKVSVFTGVRKLSDATTYAVVVELGNRGIGAAGSFTLNAPSFAAGTYGFSSQGTAVIEAQIGTSYVAPITNVLTGLADIAAPFATVRANATPSTNTGTQGTGTYGTYVFFIGRRNNASLPFNGRLYQLLVRGAASDAVTVQQTERWVAQRTGVTL